MINKLVNRKTIQKTNGIVELHQNGSVFELHIKVIFIKKGVYYVWPADKRKLVSQIF